MWLEVLIVLRTFFILEYKSIEDFECYWNPPQDVLDSQEHVEYLFQGYVKVLKKIK